MSSQRPYSIISRVQLEAMIRLAAGAPPGDFAEVGVFHGGSAYFLYEIALIQGRELHLFDTFSGTPVHTQGLDSHGINGEFADEDAPARIRKLMPTAALHIGIYPETHPQDLKNLAFVHCDCDQYLSYKAVIEQMWPLVVPGGFLLFDDYPYLPGARRAVLEHFREAELQLAGQRYYVVKASERS